MRITAAQLRAIEKAIGRDAKVSVEVYQEDYGMRRNSYVEVTAIHEGRKVYAKEAIPQYAGVPPLYLAERLVHGINNYIMNEEFRRVEWR